MRSILSLFLLLMSWMQLPAQTWSHAYTYDENDNWVNSALGIEQTSYGYLVVTFARPYLNGFWQQILVLRNLDSQGNELSNQVYVVDGHRIVGNLANILHQTPWGTYLFSGSLSVLNTDSQETGRAFLIEMDEYGNILNTYIHETGYFNNATSCIALEDGSIIVGGHTTYAGNPFNEAWSAMLFKLTPDWELEWDYAYLQSQIRAYEMHSVTTDQNGNILLGGRVFLLNTSGCSDSDFEMNAVVIKTDSNGNFIWKQEYGGCNWESPAFLTTTQDNSIVIASASKVPGQFVQGSDYWPHRWLIKSSPEDGSILWESYLVSLETWDGILLKAIELDNGNILTCGYDQAIGQGFRGELAMFSSEGDSLWMRSYMFEGDLESWFEDVIPSSDGGFVACGRIFPNGTGFERSWVIKVDEHGCLVPGCHLVGVEESTGEFPWSIGPNPTVDQLYVFVGGNPGHNARLELYDLQGRWIKSVDMDPNKGVTYILDMESISAGQYVLSLVTEKGVWSEKVLKQGR